MTFALLQKLSTSWPGKHIRHHQHCRMVPANHVRGGVTEALADTTDGRKNETLRKSNSYTVAHISHIHTSESVTTDHSICTSVVKRPVKLFHFSCARACVLVLVCMDALSVSRTRASVHDSVARISRSPLAGICVSIPCPSCTPSNPPSIKNVKLHWYVPSAPQ
jgi:hypothetical protein